MTAGAQELLIAEIALLVALVGMLTGHQLSHSERGERNGSGANHSQDMRRPTALSVFIWVTGAVALISAVIGGLALLADHLEAWERATISISVVLALVGVLADFFSLMPVRGTVTTRSRSMLTLAGTFIAVAGVTIAFVLVQSTPAALNQGVVFVVYGTCLSGSCGLNQRAGPGPEYRIVGPRLSDGKQVSIECLAKGRPPPGASWPWWDRVRPGSFISDAFVDRPKNGRPPYIRLCDPGDYGA
jgi:hypothetical protein